MWRVCTLAQHPLAAPPAERAISPHPLHLTDTVLPDGLPSDHLNCTCFFPRLAPRQHRPGIQGPHTHSRHPFLVGGHLTISAGGGTGGRHLPGLLCAAPSLPGFLCSWPQKPCRTTGRSQRLPRRQPWLPERAQLQLMHFLFLSHLPHPEPRFLFLYQSG